MPETWRQFPALPQTPSVTWGKLFPSQNTFIVREGKIRLHVSFAFDLMEPALTHAFQSSEIKYRLKHLAELVPELPCVSASYT